jgi:hypothetical protein
MEAVATRPNLDHVPLPVVKYTPGDEVTTINGADPENPSCFIVNTEENGRVVKMVFPPDRAAGARWVARAAAEGMINNEDDGGNAMRLDELIYVRKVLAYAMRAQNEEGNALWRKAYQDIKTSRGGCYPRDWGEKILMFYDRNPLPPVELSDICRYSES